MFSWLSKVRSASVVTSLMSLSWSRCSQFFSSQVVMVKAAGSRPCCMSLIGLFPFIPRGKVSRNFLSFFFKLLNQNAVCVFS